MTNPPQPTPHSSSPGEPLPCVVQPVNTSLTGPTIMVVCGLLGLAAAIVGVMLAVTSGLKLAEVAQPYQTGTETEEGETTTISGLELAGSQTYIFACAAPSEDLYNVTVEGGKDMAWGEVFTSSPIRDSEITVAGSQYQTQATFTPENSGTYSITFTSEDHSSPRCVVSRDLNVEPMVDDIFTATFSIIGVIVFALLGAGLTIGGAVWLFTRRRAARMAMTMLGG